MLPIIFQGYLEEFDNGDSKDFKITKPPQGAEFKVIAYAKVGIYTLVQWTLEIGEEPIFGEYLYRDQTPVARDEYLGLYQGEPTQSRPIGTLQFPELDIWNIVNPELGAYGVSPHIARQLRENIIKFTQK